MTSPTLTQPADIEAERAEQAAAVGVDLGGPDARRLWTRPGLLAVFVAVALLYGSLLPFDFQWSAAVRQSGGVAGALIDTLTAPTWAESGNGVSALGLPYALSDLVANLLLYVPLGVTLRMALRARRLGILFEIIGTAAGALALSWSVESLQGLMPARVASLYDVSANTSAALAAALVGPWVWGVYKRVAFAVYCRLMPAARVLRRLGDRPAVAMMIAAANAAVIGVWYVLEVGRAGDDGGAALPFERAYQLPYDMGALMLGRAMLVYAGIGCLLLLMTCTGRRRVTLGWVMVVITVMVLIAELARAATHDTVPDFTDALLALTAGALMTVTVYTFSLAVKRSNRRHEAKPYDGPERRGSPHVYE